MRANPFTYGNPISDPRRFFGRGRREIEQIFGRLRNAEFESSSVVGDRRIGKTSLLNYLADPGVREAHGLRADSYSFVYADLQMVDDVMGPEQLWRRLLASLDGQCPDNVILTAIRDLLGCERLDAFELDKFFQKVDDRDGHVVFLLDEFDRVTTELASLGQQDEHRSSLLGGETIGPHNHASSRHHERIRQSGTFNQEFRSSYNQRAVPCAH